MIEQHAVHATIDQIGVGLLLSFVQHHLELLLLELLLALEQRFLELLSQGFRAQHAEFGRHDFLNGRRVTVGESSGTARGIAENGALLIECDGGERQVMAGTVELT